MAEVTDVGITAGVPDTGTGTVPTLSKTNTVIGAVNETAPATDTASSGLNGRLQRVAQRLTSLLALYPSALGSAAAASSFAVTQSTEDVARVGIITETAPATDTASSGLNGRLQRIAQRLTSLIAVMPTSLATGGGLQVSGTGGLSVTATFTPAASGHTAPAVNGGAQTFTSAAYGAGDYRITGASLEIDSATAEATAWRLYLYNVTPPSAIADATGWDLPSGDRASFLGYVDLGTAVDLGSTQWVEANDVSKQIKFASANVFGYLVNLTTLTPQAVAHIVTLHTILL
jgi:hypothetical protein